MKFLDTCSINEIKKWSNFNLVDGVTTNPSLLSKEKKRKLHNNLKKFALL